MVSNNIIYGLFDPPELGGNLRYIGQSAQGLNRAYEHKKPGLLKGHNHKIHWINSLINQNKIYEVKVLKDLGEFDDPKLRDEALNQAEIELIAFYKNQGCNLTNSTDGGEGTRGNILSEETKQLISQRRKDWCANNSLPEHLWETCYKKKEHQIINNIEQKHCSRCDTFKMLNLFGKNKIRPDGLNDICKECDRVRKAEYRKNNCKKLTPEELKKSYESRKENVRNAIIAKYETDPEYKIKVGKASSKPIIATNVNNPNDIKEFESAQIAHKTAGFHYVQISSSIKSGKPYKGYFWKFKL